eukprot:939203-Amphidinium_carterae.2
MNNPICSAPSFSQTQHGPVSHGLPVHRVRVQRFGWGSGRNRKAQQRQQESNELQWLLKSMDLAACCGKPFGSSSCSFCVAWSSDSAALSASFVVKLQVKLPNSLCGHLPFVQ